MKRRAFLHTMSSAAVAVGAGAAVNDCGDRPPAPAKRPNVVLIMTDDQGYGDLGCHGNDLIRTPNIDRLAGESLELTRFYVCPTCAPTRAGLLTGRCHHRTGVMGTMSGEALIAPDEMTVAAMLRDAGYRTGIFGKWHLGDSYPRRPIDMGFEEEVVHHGGGLGQPADPPGVGYHDPVHQEKYNYTIYDNFPHWVNSNNYFDPVLSRNGVPEQFEGYCTDVFFGEAISFIERHRDEPFFVYLPTNAPHSPEIVSEDYLEPYRALGLDEKTARCYAMIENIDDNLARLRGRLASLGLVEDTILIFMGDNGPQYNRYNGGLRGRKAQFYEGGIRVPFFVHWPGKIAAAAKSNEPAANIDILPTLLDACGVRSRGNVKLDGVDLLPLMTGRVDSLPERRLFFQGNHGVPELYN
ncbi:MAG: arylsulfatase, partial [Candidatus Latescibacteria bacterium]|nr:arylsulfatase [Candidatus Latescibacterota bacterium]